MTNKAPASRTPRSLVVGMCAAALAVVVTGTVAGCGATLPGSSAPAEIDVRKLQVGNYDTYFNDFSDKYPNVQDGKVLESIRLADNVVLAAEVEPTLKFGLGGKVVYNSSTVSRVLADVTGPVVDKYGVLAGFYSGGADSAEDNAKNRLALTVLRFPNEAAAKDAARDMEAADFGVSNQNQRVTLDKYKDALAHWRPTVPTLGTWVAHGVYVIRVFAGQTNPEINGLKSLTERAIEKQIALIDQFEPTPVDEMPFLLTEKDGLLGRTLYAPSYKSSFGPSITPDPERSAIWSRRGFLHFQTDRGQTGEYLEKGAVDFIAILDKVLMFRAGDGPGADRLRDALASRPGHERRDAPVDVPGAVCLEKQAAKSAYSQDLFVCYLSYRRYTAAIRGDKLLDTQQRAAAQYAVLANSQ